MTPNARIAVSPSWMRSLLGLCLSGLVVGLSSQLAGCAAGAGAASTASASKEPLTESDEPEARKRARIRLELASSYFENGQTRVALDEIKQTLAVDPSFGSAYVLRGLVYMRLGEAALAEESFKRALQFNARDGDALHNYGWFACQEARYTEAMGLFDRALASPLYRNQGKTLLAKGICQVRMGQLTEAEANLAHAYELDAGNPIIGYNLASLMYRRGAFEKAQFYTQRLNNSEYANAETLWLGIKIERKLNREGPMQHLAEQLARRYPQSRELASFRRGAFDE